MLCRFLTAADGISQYYKPIVDKLQVFLRTALRHSGQLQATAVDLLARRAEHLPDLAAELQPLLPGLLTSYNVAVQSSTLRLLAVLLRQERDQWAGGLWPPDKGKTVLQELQADRLLQKCCMGPALQLLLLAGHISLTTHKLLL